MNRFALNKKVQVGKDQEEAQSEKDCRREIRHCFNFLYVTV